jgi:MoxR-like ATPase
VIVTSNRTREIHDALKRRCLYHWVDYPSAERELAIVKSRVPNIGAKLSQQVVGFVRCASRICSRFRALPRLSIGRRR